MFGMCAQIIRMHTGLNQARGNRNDIATYAGHAVAIEGGVEHVPRLVSLIYSIFF